MCKNLCGTLVMDFNEILRIASENQGCKDRELPEKKGINTNLGKPKRVVQDKKTKGVKSAAVQAFLKKQEQEEKKNAEEARKKKENLMKLRQEKNTVGKLRNIIKRNHTKEAIFEVEGTDKKSDTKAVPQSPQTDQQVNGKIEYTKLKSQYGGKERRALFQNIVRKPVSAQWTPKVEEPDNDSKNDDELKSGSVSTKRKDEGGKKGHSSSSSNSVSSKGQSSKSHHHHSQSKSSGESVKDKQVKEEEAKKKKNKPQGPPPLSFDDIMKLAQQKKEGPTGDGKKKAGDDKKGTTEKKSKVPDRPMTKEEKERWERVNSKEYQDWIKYGKKRPEFCINAKRKKSKATTSPGNKNGVSAISDEFVAMSDEESDEEEEDCGHIDEVKPSQNKGVNQSHGTGQSSRTVQKGQSGSSRMPKENFRKSEGKTPSASVPKAGISKPSSGSNNKSLKLKAGPDLVNSESSSKGSMNKKQSGVSSKVSGIKDSGSSQAAKQRSEYNEVHENVLVCGSGTESGLKGMNSKSHHQEMSAWDRVYGQFQKKNKKPEKKKRVIESDNDEYSDDEMDDFIVDEEDDMDDFIDDSEAMDYSKHIKAIFGYDKRKYQYMDDEDSDDMEAGFQEIEREEQRSAKIGMQEDLLDMKMEEEHKKRKMAMKKMEAKKKKYR